MFLIILGVTKLKLCILQVSRAYSEVRSSFIQYQVNRDLSWGHLWSYECGWELTEFLGDLDRKGKPVNLKA